MMSPAIGQNANGRLLVFATGSDGSLWYNRQTGAPVVVTLQQSVAGYWGASDTFINIADPSKNYGPNAYLQVRSNDTMASLIRFSLVGKIPTGAVITSAKLWVYAYLRSPSTATLTARVYRVYRGWTYNQATWLLAKTGVPWAIAGCNNTSSDRTATQTASATWSSTGWKMFSINSLGAVWYGTPSKNQGVVIKGYGTVGQLFQLCSSDHPTVSLRPKLVISYRPM
jgi:hypothetical protein